MQIQQLKWACRRGMLELDLFLLPFVEHQYDALSEAEKTAFQKLLVESDTHLQQWLLGQAVPEDVLYQKLIQKIIGHRQSL